MAERRRPQTVVGLPLRGSNPLRSTFCVMTAVRPDGSPLDAERSCYRKVRFSDQESAERKAKKYAQCIYLCEVCGGFHLTKRLIGEYVADVNLKHFLRRHKFRHDGDNDRGAYWTNGVGRLSVRKSYAKDPGELRALMDQVRVLAKKKERIEEEAARQLAERTRTLQQQNPSPVQHPSWPKPEETTVYPVKELVRELVEMGKSPEQIAANLNAQGSKHPMGTKWTAKEIEEWYPATRENRKPPETPEEHREQQAETARVQAPPVVVDERKVKKLTGEERLYVYGRIKALLAQRATPEQIAKALTDEGCRQGNGKQIDATFVSQARWHWNKEPKRSAKYAAVLIPRNRPAPAAHPAPEPAETAPEVAITPPVPRSRFGLPLTVDAVLADTEVRDDARLQILMIFVDVPASATLLLADEKLSVAQKIAVIETVGSRRGESACRSGSPSSSSECL